MDEPIVLRTESEYRTALSRIDLLLGTEEGNPEFHELSKLIDSVEQYESKHFPIEFPQDPIAAIKYRMDQLGWTQRDLVPIVGSKSKVSELLSGKRNLTLAIARAVHKHLGVPADVLLQEPGAEFKPVPDELDFSKFPLKAMAKKGWILDIPDLKERAEELVTDLMQRAGGPKAAPAPLYRKNDHRRINAKVNFYALQAWCWQLLATSKANMLQNDYFPGTVTPVFMRTVAQLSSETDGPVKAKEFLQEHGICLEIVPHLPKTYVDGAALALPGGRPVIGLTLRFDRIDNFWFCLLHELAHVGWHMDGKAADSFIDDLELRGKEGEGIGPEEAQADKLAEEALIPQAEWEVSQVREKSDMMSVIEFSNRINVHPAVVAGRIRYERDDYRLLSQLVGSGKVRPLFEPV